MAQCCSKVKKPWSSSITSANAMPTSVINSRVVLIVRLICHVGKVYEEIIFCKTSQYKSQMHFPSQNNQTCTKLTLSNNQPFCQEEINSMGFFPSFSFQFHFDQIRSTKVTYFSASRNSSRNAAIHEKRHMRGLVRASVV